jgi:hypothetical protein
MVMWHSVDGVRYASSEQSWSRMIESTTPWIFGANLAVIKLRSPNVELLVSKVERACHVKHGPRRQLRR